MGTGFVRMGRGGWEIDPSLKLSSLIANSVILDELTRFLDRADRMERLLDVGCGTQPYAPLYRPHFKLTLACDLPSSLHDLSGVDFLAEVTALPLTDKSVDCVLCTEVLEHVPEPTRALDEMARVLRPGGYLVLTVPFLEGLHEEPRDYYRYTRHALTYLLSRAGFTVERMATKGDALAVLLATALWPMFKIWSFVSGISGLRWLYSPRNPVLWMFGVVPQRLYLRWYDRVAGHPTTWGGRMYRRLDYLTLGYVVVARRDATAG